jgi:hypothetical protein
MVNGDTYTRFELEIGEPSAGPISVPVGELVRDVHLISKLYHYIISLKL